MPKLAVPIPKAAPGVPSGGVRLPPGAPYLLRRRSMALSTCAPYALPSRFRPSPALRAICALLRLSSALVAASFCRRMAAATSSTASGSSVCLRAAS